MPAIITKNYRVLNAQTLINSISGATPINTLYLFISKTLPWTVDTSPPEALDNSDSTNDIWGNMIAMKRILRSDVSLGIKKRSWVYGSYYDIYRHDYGATGVTGISLTGQQTTPAALYEANYYVVTENGNVYMCVDNNKGGQSLDNPQNYGTGTGFDVFTTSDNYRWKFISTVSATDYAKFSTLEFHPAQTISVEPLPGDVYETQYLQQQNALTKGGSIFHVMVTSGGSSSYTSTTIGTLADQSLISVKGDGQGLKVKAYTDSNGAVTKMEVLSYGTGYTYCTISVTGVTNATFVPIITPLNGLGADPVRDLNAFYLLTDVKLSYAEGAGDFTVNNDYRQIGIIANPLAYNGSVATSSTLDASYALTLPAGGSFSADGVITNNTNGTKAAVVDWTPGTTVLRVNLPKPSDTANWASNLGFSVGNSVSQAGGPQNISITAVTTPEVKPYSGEVIYYENRRPVARDASQIEDIHISIEF